jgi:hypothetical protein
VLSQTVDQFAMTSAFAAFATTCAPFAVPAITGDPARGRS